MTTLEKNEPLNMPQPHFKEGLLLFILAAINFTHIMDFVIVAPLNPFLKNAFHITTREFGFLVASYTLSAGVSGFLAFFWVDKFDRRAVLLSLYMGFILGNVLCALAPTFSMLITARIVAGAFGGVMGAVIMSVVGDVIPPERRGKATGIVMSAFAAASVIGIPLGLIFAEKYDWHAPFIFLSCISVVVFGLMYFKLPSLKLHLKNAIVENPIQMLSSIFSNGNVRWALLFTILVMLAGFTVVPYISDYMVFNVGLPKEDLRYIYLFGGIATVASGPIVGRLADKFGKQKIYAIVATCSIAPILLITHLPVLSKPLIFLASTSFFIFFGGRFVPAMAIMTGCIEPRNRGKFMSINSSTQQLANALATSIAGFIIYNTSTGQLVGFGTVGVLASVLTLASIFIAYRVKQVS